MLTTPDPYYRARYYDPAIGRFANEDPAGFKGGRNFYVYAGNDPEDLTDPLGLAPGGGPWHPPAGVAPGCKPGDSCSVIMGKLSILSTMLASHIWWDFRNYTSRHQQEIDDLGRAIGNCLAQAAEACPKCMKIPAPPSIPGPYPVVISPCLIDPYAPSCPLGKQVRNSPPA